MKLNPFIINVLISVLYFVGSLIILFAYNFSGGASFEFFINSLALYPILGFVLNLILIFLYRKWTEKHWLITIVQFLIYSVLLMMFSF